MDAGDAGASVAREIALCWLAHALASVARRMCVQSPSAARVELVSVIPATNPNDTLALLLRALHSHDEIHNAALSVTSVSSIQQLLPVDPFAYIADAGAGQDAARTVKLVVMEMEHDAWEAIQPTLKSYTSAAEPSPTIVWLFVGVTISRRTGLLVRVAPITSSPYPVDLYTALQPLRDLAHQCGLALALELLAAIDPTLDQCHTTASAPTIPKVSHLPFQLLLMLLRWSYFHPRIVSLLATPLIRKLTLTPQRRVQQEILDMFQTHRRLWTTLHRDHPEHTAVQTLLTSLQQPRRPHHLQLPDSNHNSDDDPENGDEQLPPLRRLSQCALWDLQKQFYRNQGIHAWSHHLIPFGVSSSSFLARQYARLAVDFFTLQFKSSPSLPAAPHGEGLRTPNCFVWEAASGSCKFLHAFLLHFYELVTQERLEELLGIVPCVVASDLSDQVLQSREEMASFQQYLADHRLDFALFDTDDFLGDRADKTEKTYTTKSSLYLRNAQRLWRVGVDDGPVFIVGNYFLDSLRSDVFVATQHSTSTPRLEVREALIDSETDTIPDMLFSLHKLDRDPRQSPVYGQPALDTTLAATLDQLEREWKTTPPLDDARCTEDDTELVTQSSLLLFPAEAIRFLDTVLHKTTVPVAFVAGDATFSFRDAVPSSFIDHETGDLEIPQLSPHPDCFCLPVDFEILQHFVLSSAAVSCGSCASIVASPSSDTFNVFFAQSAACTPQLQSELQQRFREGLDRFSPCDCDLLWGMMRVDAGTESLSFDTQLALLAQTAFDFDVFSVVQWGLLHYWKEQRKKKPTKTEELEMTLLISPCPRRFEAEAAREKLEQMRRRLVAVGTKSQRTFYVMDEHTQSRDSSEAAIATLQLARWFYELGEWETVPAVLGDVADHDHPRLRAGSLYLCGLASYHLKDFWAALSWFRKGLQLEPKRLRLKKWIARTLLRLQELKQRTNSSIAAVVEVNTKTEDTWRDASTKHSPSD